MYVHPRIVIGVPSEITQVEKRAVRDSAMRAGASEVFLVEQAMMAAIGAGLPITEPSGNMIVDIGGGTTDVAVISLAGTVYSRSVRVAGNEMDEAIIQYLKRKYNLLIGERTAEQIKIEIGSAYPLKDELTMEIKGRDLVEGVPKTLTITDEEIREALAEPVGDHRRGGAHGARAHAARAVGRHHGQGHRALGRRRAAAQPRPAAARRDRPAGGARRGPAGLGGARHRPRARGHRPAAQGVDPLRRGPGAAIGAVDERRTGWLLIVAAARPARAADLAGAGRAAARDTALEALGAAPARRRWRARSPAAGELRRHRRRASRLQRRAARRERSALRARGRAPAPASCCACSDLEDEIAPARRARSTTRAPPAAASALADVVYVDHASWLRTLVSTPATAGARLDQPVLAADGPGRPGGAVAGPYAKVQLRHRPRRRRRRDDRAHPPPGRGARRAAAAALELDYVPLQADVRPGDRVLTAGIDGVYPRGIPIGTVVAVEPGGAALPPHPGRRRRSTSARSTRSTCWSARRCPPDAQGGRSAGERP